SDPNNSNTFYIGAGESYTSGAGIGRGIWQSTDGGVTWSNIFGGYTSSTVNGSEGFPQFVNGIFYVNDLVARNVGGATELYAAVAGAFHADGSNIQGQWHSLNEQGLYRSTNNGASWTKINLWDDPPTNSFPINPNDLEIDSNNDIWLSTTSSSWGFAGGKIFQSNAAGTAFTLINTIAGANRTEIEPSGSTPGTWFIAANVSSAGDLLITTNDFATYGAMTAEPNSLDPGTPAADYTRGQAFYDLPIESDASGNIIVGGIDLFWSTDTGTTWPQISQWYNYGAGVSIVHADHHAIVQRPGAGNANQYIFGTDGGVFYTPDISLSAGGANIFARNTDYNTVQFYYGAYDTSINGAGDDLFGGTQDNGTPGIINAVAGANPSVDFTGGDGGHTELDDAGLYILTAFPGNTHYVNDPSLTPPNHFYQISTGVGGSFINEAELDNNLEILYTNRSSGATYEIERIATFTGGVANPVTTTLTNALLNDAPSAFKVSPYTGGSTKLFVGLENGRLLRIDNADGGAPTWNNITGPGFVGSISDIELGESENDIFVTFHNYGVVSVWATNNGGGTWTNIEGNLPDMPVKCILQNPLLSNELIIGTDLGIWATADYTVASPVWFQTDNGMLDVTVLDLDVRSDNSILASTHGRGFFTSQFDNVTLSVANNSFSENAIQIIPTISDGNFSLNTQRALGTIDFSLYDLNGKKVYDSRFDMTINIKEFSLNLNAGLYIVKIKSDNSLVTKRLIIK
ncbi:MAG: T9SS type A sorting domain-containing protein, partial [Bacteroidia bacterium]|nr:T9SS type A sorting domain-containing protein [Bacteroidia bacterium]